MNRWLAQLSVHTFASACRLVYSLILKSQPRKERWVWIKDLRKLLSENHLNPSFPFSIFVKAGENREGDACYGGEGSSAAVAKGRRLPPLCFRTLLAKTERGHGG